MRWRPAQVRDRPGARACLVVIAMLLAGADLGAQRGAQIDADLRPAEVQQLFDAFVLVQAQEALSLTDAQFAPFVSSLKRLQETRRRSQQEAQRLLRGLQQLASRAGTPEGELQTRLDELDEHRARAAEAVQAAYADVDGVLDVRQRVRFRMFEQRMERRQLELLMRARNARGGGATAPRRQRPNQTR